MQLPRTLIFGQPRPDEIGSARRVAQFEETMRALMRCVRIPRIAGERALDQPGPSLHLAGFDIGPTEITKKPPILAPMRRQSLQQRKLLFVMIEPPTKPDEPEDAERQRQRQRIPRELGDMRTNQG